MINVGSPAYRDALWQMDGERFRPVPAGFSIDVEDDGENILWVPPKASPFVSVGFRKLENERHIHAAMSGLKETAWQAMEFARIKAEDGVVGDYL